MVGWRVGVGGLLRFGFGSGLFGGAVGRCRICGVVVVISFI